MEQLILKKIQHLEKLHPEKAIENLILKELMKVDQDAKISEETSQSPLCRQFDNEVTSKSKLSFIHSLAHVFQLV